MSRSTPQRRMTCAKCRERDTYSVLVSESAGGFYNPTWFNVEAVSRHGRKVLCVCQTCKHSYLSGSIAAHRAIEYMERKAHNA